MLEGDLVQLPSCRRRITAPARERAFGQPGTRKPVMVETVTPFVIHGGTRAGAVAW
ncbi:hypothetical protein [Actinophytocola sp.]|uniref:hypothetical protein n=1 Tax=Actinophytocola sp. TaxID=1872138 RepID=UPI002D3E9B73|nr:hypothetical protein [Actinophytocola sp.]HYQ68657.1 hypothetical protein [Actinophytocola sp.]